jgi:hypothetical protein
MKTLGAIRVDALKLLKDALAKALKCNRMELS